MFLPTKKKKTQQLSSGRVKGWNSCTQPTVKPPLLTQSSGSVPVYINFNTREYRFRLHRTFMNFRTWYRKVIVLHSLNYTNFTQYPVFEIRYPKFSRMSTFYIWYKIVWTLLNVKQSRPQNITSYYYTQNSHGTWEKLLFYTTLCL